MIIMKDAVRVSSKTGFTEGDISIADSFSASISKNIHS